MIRNISSKELYEMSEKTDGYIFLDSFFSCATIMSIKFVKNKKIISASLPAPAETIEQIKTLSESNVVVYSTRFNGKDIEIDFSNLDEWNDFLKIYAAFNMMGQIKIKKLINFNSISLNELRKATMQILKENNSKYFLAKKPDFRESPFKEAYQKDILEIFGK